MKTLFTFLTLPVIVLICFFSERLYISGDLIISYALVLASFLSVALWINHVGQLMQKQRA